MKEMTSTRIAMPAKVYEYIGMGLPLVVAPSGELHDFVKVNKIGLAFKEMNILQITDGIIALEKNRESFFKISTKMYFRFSQLLTVANRQFILQI